MIIDLRSDTVTKPTYAMKEAMFQAKVGDDVLGDDPTVIALEEKAAQLFGHETALFCPSGTMTNQIAIKVHTNSPGEVICDELAHIYRYEGGGIGFNSGLSAKLLKGNRGRFSLAQLIPEINADDVHFPPTQLVSIENTCNKGGGCCWDLEEIKKIASFCKEEKLPLHLDGARLYNALVAKNTTPADMGQQFDSISLCLSKGLGCPVGSLLIGNKRFIKQARRIRKVLGGGMRQAGYLAAAGIYALDNNVDRLKTDHENAKTLGQLMAKKSFVQEVLPVETNILIFKLDDTINSEDYLNKLKENGIRAVGMGHQTIRFVTHLGIGNQEMEQLIKYLDK